MFRTLVVTAGGLGKLRPAPGSWGSLPPCFIAVAMSFLGIAGVWIDLALLLLLILSGAGAIWLGGWAEQKYRAKDPGVVVVDEVAGMSLALLAVPLAPQVGSGGAGGAGLSLTSIMIVGAGYVLFRIIDIVKPPPAGAAQQFPRGWGILADDLVAGLYVNLLLQVFLRLVLPVLAGTPGGV